MLSKSKIKQLQSLKLKKFRQKYNLFLAEGDKIIDSLLNHKPSLIHEIVATPAWIAEYGQEISDIHLIETNDDGIKTISSLQSHPSVIAVVKMPLEEKFDFKRINKAIYLDDVQDPGNVGTIIRLADWYGIDAVIRSIDSADFYNPKVVQSTMGSFANVNLSTLPKEELILQKGQLNMIGTTMNGTPLNQVGQSQNMIIIMGNEGSGISNSLLVQCDQLVSIPGHESRLADSLNVSVSAGIIMQHFFSK
jgi:TrmH family RNA methyltransferase